MKLLVVAALLVVAWETTLTRGAVVFQEPPELVYTTKKGPVPEPPEPELVYTTKKGPVPEPLQLCISDGNDYDYFYDSECRKETNKPGSGISLHVPVNVLNHEGVIKINMTQKTGVIISLRFFHPTKVSFSLGGTPYAHGMEPISAQPKSAAPLNPINAEIRAYNHDISGYRPYAKGSGKAFDFPWTFGKYVILEVRTNQIFVMSDSFQQFRAYNGNDMFDFSSPHGNKELYLSINRGLDSIMKLYGDGTNSVGIKLID